MNRKISKILISLLLVFAICGTSILAIPTNDSMAASRKVTIIKNITVSVPNGWNIAKNENGVCAMYYNKSAQNNTSIIIVYTAQNEGYRTFSVTSKKTQTSFKKTLKSLAKAQSLSLTNLSTKVIKTNAGKAMYFSSTAKKNKVKTKVIGFVVVKNDKLCMVFSTCTPSLKKASQKAIKKMANSISMK